MGFALIMLKVLQFCVVFVANNLACLFPHGKVGYLGGAGESI